MSKTTLSVPEQHQKRIAIATLKMSNVGALIMGGMTKEEARNFLRSHGFYKGEIKRIDETPETISPDPVEEDDEDGCRERYAMGEMAFPEH